MTVNDKPHRPLAALKLPRKVSELIGLAHVVVKAMTGNPTFPTPTPAVAVMQAALDDLVAAEAFAAVRTTGAAAFRNAKKQRLVTLLEEWRTCVQSTADASPENGPSIIQSSGTTLRKAPQRKALGFHAKPAASPGSVQVVAPAAARRACYDWQSSVDGGKTWVDSRSTLQSRTVVAGLPSMTTVQLRYRAIVKAGEGSWSPPISFFVV